MWTGDNERELERLLAAAAVDPAERPAFSSALLASEVYVLGTVDGDIVDGVVPAGAKLNLRGGNDASGPYTAFYTSEDTLSLTLSRHPEADRRFVRLNLRTFLEVAQGSRLLLNPDSPYGKEFLPDEIAALIEGREPGLTTEVVKEQTAVQIGAAAHVPPELPAVLARFLIQRPVVEAAHLGWIAHGDGHQGYLLVVVSKDRDQAMAGFGAINIAEVTNGATLDVVVVAPNSKDGFVTGVPRFFQRPEHPQPSNTPRRWRRRR